MKLQSQVFSESNTFCRSNAVPGMGVLVSSWFLLVLMLAAGGFSTAVGQEPANAIVEDALLSMLVKGIVIDAEGAAVAGARVETVPGVGGTAYRTQTLKNGAFALRLPGEGHYGQPLLVTSEDGRLNGFVAQYEYKSTDRAPLRIVLKSPSQVDVKVVDSNDQPVAEATVFLQAAYTELFRGKTNNDGRLRVSFPWNAKVDWICAFKDGVGFDYYENYDAFPTQDRLQVPESISLRLEGAHGVTVVVNSTDGEPVEGIWVGPWTIKKPGKISYANIGGATSINTGKDGQARFAWFPADIEGGITLSVYHSQFHCKQYPRWNGEGEQRIQATVLRNPTVRGRVTFADGSPAAGIRLQGEGRGATNNYFRGYTRTKSDGSYEMDIYPDQTTIIAVTDENYAAQSKTDLLLAEGQQQDDVDFQLMEGTLIRGKFFVGGEPAAGQTATLVQRGEGSASLVRWAESDASGSYFFKVGPGEYELMLGPDRSIVEVQDQAELVFDSRQEHLPRGQLSGKVMDENNQPLEGAKIFGESINAPGHAGFKTESKADGSFATERWNDRMLIYAFHEAKGLAASKTIKEDDRETELVLRKAASLRGRVVDSEGRPLNGLRVEISVETWNLQERLRHHTVSDAEGKFEFPAVAVDTICQITAYQRDYQVIDRHSVSVERGQDYEVPDFVVK